MRDAWRPIRRMPGLSAVVVFSLGVGIGLNTAIFTWIQALVLRPIPGVRDAGTFDLVEPRTDSGTYPGVSWPEYRDLQDRLHAFQDLMAYRPMPVSIGEDNRTER